MDGVKETENNPQDQRKKLFKSTRKMDLFFLLLAVILVFFTFYFESHPEKAQIIQVSTYQEKLTNLRMGLWISFIICIVGNILPLPTPYILITWMVSQEFKSIHFLIPLLVAFISSLGSLVGEITGYFVGRGAGELIPQEEGDDSAKFFERVLISNPKTAPFLIYLFGATPLNDDLITVPLGLIKYSFKKTVFWCWFGKLSMMIMVAFFPDLLDFSNPEYSFWTTMFPLFGIIFIFYLFFKVNWEVIIQRLPRIRQILHIDESQK